MTKALCYRAGVVVAGIALAAGSAWAQKPAGESWDFSGTMKMDGMSMPIPPHKSCVKPDEAVAPPVEKNCKTTDMKVSGNTTSFKVVCGPPEPMTGTAKVTRTADTLEGTYTMKSSDGEMTMVFNGKKLGNCTPGK